MTSSFVQHLASYPETPAGSRALAAHLRNDHGIRGAIYRSTVEGHPIHSTMHVVAHRAEQGGLLCTCSGFQRPHPLHGPVPAGAEPAGGGNAWDAAYEHEWVCISQQHGPDAVYRCRCGQTAPGAEIGVTEQARDWFYAPAGRRQARVPRAAGCRDTAVTTRQPCGRWPGTCAAKGSSRWTSTPATPARPTSSPRGTRPRARRSTRARRATGNPRRHDRWPGRGRRFGSP